jgi:predicted dienelactone hydrolase
VSARWPSSAEVGGQGSGQIASRKLVIPTVIASALPAHVSPLDRNRRGRRRLDRDCGQGGDGPVTVYYPSSGEAQTLKRGPFTFQMAWQGVPARGNGRLIVMSHGSGGSPWVHSDLARTLVDMGFVVAVPEHRGDNVKDHSTPGPESWRRRPAEVSRAIDAVAQDYASSRYWRWTRSVCMACRRVVTRR